MPDFSQLQFPAWIAFSGLPARLAEVGKSQAPWLLLRSIIELDCERHPLQPGMVEVTPAELCATTGIDPEKLEKIVKVLRKEGLVRCFLPDHPDDAALFQVLCPLKTPTPADDVRRLHSSRFDSCPWPPRYAEALPEPDATGGGDLRQQQLAKIQRVVDLYLSLFSMKINNLILEELQLIAHQYELPLIERVFERARRTDKRSLGWIVSEARRERKLLEKPKAPEPSGEPASAL